MSGGDRLVPVARVFEHAVEQIVAAAGELWPDVPVRLGEHVPSVTSYVRRIWVGGHPLFAKYSVLGSSLVSVLRGAHGGWEEIEPAQRRYVHARDAVLARQAGQLHRLAAQLRVCGVADHHNGVLFTEAITNGVPLDELLLAEPQHTPVLLRRVWEPMARLHRLPVDGWSVIPERDIVATFSRMFLPDKRGTVHFGQIRRGVDPQVVAGLRSVVHRLRAPVTRSTTGLVYGDATPEHVIVTGAEPVYLDPGVHVASAVADLATLVSRLLLVVMSEVPATSARRHIVAGLTDLVRQERSTVSLASSSAWMSELLALVARDAANILSTYLTAPETFPLPRSAEPVLERVGVAVPVVEHVVTGLAQHVDPVEIWARVTAEVIGA